MTYTKELLEQIVPQCRSIAEVGKKINGVSAAGGTHNHISKKIKQYNIDISHFSGQGWCKAGPAKQLNKEDILVVNRRNGKREKIVLLRRAIRESRYQI